jgi:hypothetical protein
MGLQSERIVILSSRTNAYENLPEIISFGFQGLWENGYPVQNTAKEQAE